METMDDILVSFHGGGKLKQGTSSHDLPYSHIIPNHHVLAPHQVGECLPWPDGSGIIFGWRFVITPGSTARRRKRDDLARARTKDKGKGFVHQLTFYLWPSSPSNWLSSQELRTLPQGSSHHQTIAQACCLCCSHPIALPSPNDAFWHQLLCHRHWHFCLNHLGNHHNQFEDLKMDNDTEVEGIKGGLDMKGSGTFKVHLIKIPNIKYVPDLRVGLLSPHHWAQVWCTPTWIKNS